jgi:hypothetical protein
MAHGCAISKNHGVPKRSISPESFDAILSELGDDPAIGHPALRSNTSIPEGQTMNRHSYEADAHRLSEQFPQHKNRKGDPIQGAPSPLIKNLQFSALLQASPIWLAMVACMVAATLLNSYWLFELRSSQRLQPVAADEAGQSVDQVKAIVLSLKDQLEDDHELLLSELESLEGMVLQNTNATRARNTHGLPAPKMSPAEQSLKRWRYLGMSNSNAGISGLFHTGEGMQHIALNSPAVEGWRLSSVTRELAMLTSNDGKSVAISVSKE